jgi:hypothetical protein
MADVDLESFDISRLKLGRGDAVRPVGIRDLAVYLPGGWPTPPATFGDLATLQAISWGMDGNDTLGDCTIAGADHIIAAGNALYGTSDPRPDLPTLEGQYRTLSPNDTGCIEADVLNAWHTKGLFGPADTNTIVGYAPIDHRSEAELKAVTAATGFLYLGIACPQSAQQQFAKQLQSGQLVPWTVVRGSKVEGGHCIVAVGYDATGLFCVTWGGVVNVTWPFLRRYLDEAWAVLTEELSERGTDKLGLDLAQLQADLRNMSASAH